MTSSELPRHAENHHAFSLTAGFFSSHQSWGLKYNFSNYSSFWDLVCGTYQSGCSPEALERYAKGRKEKKAATGDAASSLRPVAGTGDGSSTAIEY